MICGMCLRKQLVSKSTPLRTFATTASSLQQHSPRPLKLAIIGAGPSGFYAASRLLSLLPADSPEGAKVQVDMYERLPTPYGLARYGVAPDHPEVKVSQAVSTYYLHCLDTGVPSDQIADKVFTSAELPAQV